VTGPARVTPHVLRHTAATFMAMRGVPLPQIAAFLGQTIQKTTEKYIHVTPTIWSRPAPPSTAKACARVRSGAPLPWRWSLKTKREPHDPATQERSLSQGPCSPKKPLEIKGPIRGCRQNSDRQSAYFRAKLHR